MVTKGFASAFFIGLSVFLFLIGVVAEMLDRMRAAQEEIIFRVRRMEHDLARARSENNVTR